MMNYGTQEVLSMDKKLEMWLEKKREQDIWNSANRSEDRHQELDIFDEWESGDDSLVDFKNLINRLAGNGVDDV